MSTVTNLALANGNRTSYNTLNFLCCTRFLVRVFFPGRPDRAPAGDAGPAAGLASPATSLAEAKPTVAQQRRHIAVTEPEEAAHRVARGLVGGGARLRRRRPPPPRARAAARADDALRRLRRQAGHRPPRAPLPRHLAHPARSRFPRRCERGGARRVRAAPVRQHHHVIACKGELGARAVAQRRVEVRGREAVEGVLWLLSSLTFFLTSG